MENKRGINRKQMWNKWRKMGIKGENRNKMWKW